MKDKLLCNVHLEQKKRKKKERCTNNEVLSIINIDENVFGYLKKSGAYRNK